MKYTTNLQLKKPDYTDLADIQDMNENMDLIDSQLGDKTNILIPNVNSTANAIILDCTLQDKGKYSFKAIANSTGAVTINGIALKKVDGTAISNLKVNKVYDFYYDNTSNSVFILAKAEGDATVADVLAGKIFSNGDDTGLVGIATIESLGGTRIATGTITLVKSQIIDISSLAFTPSKIIFTFNGYYGYSLTEYKGTRVLSSANNLWCNGNSVKGIETYYSTENGNINGVANPTNFYIKDKGFYYKDTNIYTVNASYPTIVNYIAYE